MRSVVLTAVAALALLAGCGSRPPEDVEVNRALVRDAVLQWHALQAARDPKACELVTEKAGERMLAFERKLASALGTAAPDDCEAMISGRSMDGQLREAMVNTVVDDVQLDGERATVTAHTRATVDGVLRDIPPAILTLRWDDGRWRLD